MNGKTCLFKIFFSSAFLGSIVLPSAAENSCPTIADSGSEISLTFTNAGLENLVKFGYGSQNAANFIQASASGKSSSATIELAPLTFFSSFTTIPVSCDSTTGECSSDGASINVARYRLTNDIAFVNFFEGETSVTTVIDFGGTAPTVTCYGTNQSFDSNELVATFDFTDASEQLTYSNQTTCTEAELYCPTILPNSIIFSDTGGTESQRGPLTVQRASALAKKGLRTGGLDNRKKILVRAIKQLNSFVSSKQFRSSSQSLRSSVRKNIALAKRAIKRNAGSKMVHAALLAIKGK